jgi:DNA-binding response OmpR family regulator
MLSPLHQQTESRSGQVCDAPHRKILLMGQNNSVAQLLELELAYEGYQVNVAPDGITGLLMVRQSNPDLLLLNGSLSGLSSQEICHRLRSTNNMIPIIVITEEDSSMLSADQNRVASLIAGATDAFSSPFSLDELITKIRLNLQRLHPQWESDVLRFENIILNKKMHRVYREDQLINLTAREFALLAYFMEYPNQVLSQAQILDAVWGYNTNVCSNLIEVYVGYLRRKLEANNPKRLLQTVRGVGYVLRVNR